MSRGLHRAAVWMCVAALAVPVFAQASVSGRWRLTLQTDPVETLDATLTQAGPSVTGEISSASGPVEAQGTLVDGVLTLYYSSYLNGQPAEVTLRASLTDEGLAGSLLVNGATEIPFTGVPQP